MIPFIVTSIFTNRFIFLLLKWVLLLWLIFTATHVKAQTEAKKKGNVYAVVVGITQYQENSIKPLKYANRDAELFTSYLLSPAGGAVPESNIRLLIDNEATYTAIYSALYWLLNVAEEDDLVYFYFSGHGDVESQIFKQLGFLITYNTPPNNYMGSALSIQYLNYCAHTLSLNNKAKVIIITDACHSGKLAGSDFDGNSLAGKQLDTVMGNELRLASCDPKEKSNEDKRWGGGRGVFSFYLLKALTGQADRKVDSILTVDELKSYMEKSMSKDPILFDLEAIQTPIVKGGQNFNLSVPSKRTLDTATSQRIDSTKILPKQPQWYFFDAVKKIKQERANDTSKHIEGIFDLEVINKYDSSDIPLKMIEMCMKAYPSYDVHDNPGKLTELKDLIQQNPFTKRRFMDALVNMFNSRGDEIINLYLSGDESELEKQRYYNFHQKYYSYYPYLYEIALKLNKDPELKNILQVKMLFFKALMNRLSMITQSNPESLINASIKMMYQALSMEGNAPYIHHELGLLYSYQMKPDSAIKYFRIASSLSPTWSMPYINLSGVYLYQHNLKDAKENLDEAIKLQPNAYNTIVREATWYEANNNYLLAKELYHKAIRINSRHFVPFEKLAYLYLKTNQYDLAEFYLKETEKRKAGYYFVATGMTNTLNQSRADLPEVMPCTFPADLPSKDIISIVMAGLQQLQQYEKDSAATLFRMANALDKNNPLVYYWLGQVSSNFTEAEWMLHRAEALRMDSNAYRKYADSAKKWMTNSNADFNQCVYQYYLKSNYSEVELKFVMANLYKKSYYFDKAEKIYLELLATPQGKQIPAVYYCLWKLYETEGRFDDAERIIRSYVYQDEVDALLFAYFKRITSYAQSPIPFYKAGKFLYEYATTLNLNDPCDVIDCRPDPELHIGVWPPENCKESFRSSFKGRSFIIPGINEKINTMVDTSYPKRNAVTYLRMADELLSNGINDNNLLADVNYKLGHLYYSMQVFDSATIRFEKAGKLKPHFNSYKELLIEAGNRGHEYTMVKLELESLLSQNTISFHHAMLRAKYFMDENQPYQADSILNQFNQLQPLNDWRLPNLRAELFMQQKQYAKAITLYESLIKTDNNNLIWKYQLAKLNALNGNKNKALAWVETITEAGWDKVLVMRYDPVWANYKSMNKWKKMESEWMKPR